jgi:hypothetical protein
MGACRLRMGGGLGCFLLSTRGGNDSMIEMDKRNRDTLYACTPSILLRIDYIMFFPYEELYSWQY